jgi:hypothetical protein
VFGRVATGLRGYQRHRSHRSNRDHTTGAEGPSSAPSRASSLRSSPAATLDLACGDPRPRLRAVEEAAAGWVPGPR